MSTRLRTPVTHTDDELRFQARYRLLQDSYHRPSPPWYRERMKQWVSVRREQLIQSGVHMERIEELEREVREERA